MANLRVTPNYFSLGSPWLGSGSATSFRLDSTYVHLTSGDAIAVRYMVRTAEPINEFYLFFDAFIGTLGSLSARCDIYNYNTVQPTRPGATLRDSSDITTIPGAVDRWMRFQFSTPYTPAVGEIIWFVVHNTAASPTVNAPEFRTATNAAFAQSLWTSPFTTTAGFSANGTSVTEANFVVQEGSQYFGQPLTTLTSVFNANDLNKKGVVVTPPVDCKPAICEFVGGDADNAQLQIYTSNQLPTDTPWWSMNLEQAGREGDNLIAIILQDPPILRKGQTYYVVFNPVGVSPSPNGVQINDYSSYPAMFDSFVDNVNHTMSVRANAGAWDISSEVWPRMGLLVSEITAPTITS